MTNPTLFKDPGKKTQSNKSVWNFLHLRLNIASGQKLQLFTFYILEGAMKGVPTTSIFSFQTDLCSYLHRLSSLRNLQYPLHTC